MLIYFCYNIYRFSNGMIFQWGLPTILEKLTIIFRTITVKTVITKHVLVFCKVLPVCCLEFFTSFSLKSFLSNKDI